MNPRLVCHRGASLEAPENTFAAARAALDKGAHIIELDVRESADGVLYVMHDRVVDRTTDGTGRLELMSATEIDALDAGRWFAPEFEGERVPRLDAYLDFLQSRGAGAYGEIKWCDPSRAAAVIREAGMVEASFTFSFKPEMREGMARQIPELRRMITLDIARNVSVAQSLHGAAMVEMEVANLNAATVASARAAGLEVMAYYDGDDAEVFRRFVAAGVDYINHDHLDVALGVLEEST